MKKVGIAVVLASMIFAGASGAAEPVKLKLSTVVPPKGIAVAKILKPWAEMVTKESQGTLEIEVYGGGVLGRDIKMYLKQINSGVFDIGFFYPTIWESASLILNLYTSRSWAKRLLRLLLGFSACSIKG